jgi:hypothetical protein
MFPLKEFIEKGLLTDLFKADKSLASHNILGANSTAINKRNDETTHAFSYIQRLCLHEYVMSIARIYDSESRRNKTRCLIYLIHKLQNNPELFPKVIEKYQTENHVKFYGLNTSLTQALSQDDSIIFTKRLGFNLFARYQELDAERKIIKSWRDKILSHNDENDKVESIVFSDTNKLLDFGWLVITVLGWAYLNTVFGFEGSNDLREDARGQGNQLITIINKLIL